MVTTRFRFRAALVAFTGALLLPVCSSGQDVLPSSPVDWPAREQAARRKLETSLRAMVDAPTKSAATRTITVVADAARDVDALAGLVGRFGGSVRHRLADTIEADVPDDAVLPVAALPQVVRVREARAAAPRVTSQGVSVHNVANWQARQQTGAGVKVGIIDSFAGLDRLLGTELPSAVQARCYFRAGGVSANLADCVAQSTSPHGTAVAEAIADIAPGAAIYIALAWTDGDLRDATEWMVQQGVRVINFSASTLWDGPGDGTSPHAFSMLNTVAWASTQHCLFVVAAGNEAASTWFGPPRDANGNGLIDFGGSDLNSIDLAAGESVVLQLRWEGRWNGALTDLDLYLVDSAGEVVAASLDQQNGRPGDDPFEVLGYTSRATGRYYIGVDIYGGPPTGWVQLQDFFSGSLGVSSGGAYSIGNPAESNSPSVLAVGAARWSSPTTLEWFSSRGPTPAGRIKPDLVAADGGDSVTYGPGGFLGTSQASPHVAGLAALILARNPVLWGDEVATRLKQWATPVGAQPNNDWGYGLARVHSLATLRLLVSGTGAGWLVLSPPDYCARDCSYVVEEGLYAGVSAYADLGSVFSGWSPACTNSPMVGSCVVLMTSDTTLTGIFTVSPPYCTFQLSAGPQHFGSSGGRVTINVTASHPDCEWTATAASAWVSVTPANGVGNGPLTLTVAASTSGYERATSAGIGDASVPITQDGDPGGTYRRYLAEGATGDFFKTRLALANPGATPALTRLDFLTGAGHTVTQTLTIPPTTRRTIDVASIGGLASTEFSTLVESDAPIVVDRTMSWDAAGYGAHAETAVAGPEPTWYLAEGATHSGFDLFYLIQNPNAVDTTVTVTYLRPWGSPQIVKTYLARARSRLTIWVDQEGPELANTDVSAVISALPSTPIIVERAMYRSGPRAFEAGHDSAGVTAPSSQWFFAEGATGPMFDLFLLLANPTATQTAVRVDYFLPDGTVVHQEHILWPLSRITSWVNFGDSRLRNTSLSIKVWTVDGTPFIAERTMWWPQETSTVRWEEAHNSPGVVTTGTLWALAEGETGGGTETYVLIANTSPTSGVARVTLMFEDGTTAARDVALLPRSRTSIAAGITFPSAIGRRFATTVESLGPNPVDIVVERAMYSSDGGAPRFQPYWPAGTAAVGTRLR